MRNVMILLIGIIMISIIAELIVILHVLLVGWWWLLLLGDGMRANGDTGGGWLLLAI